MAEFTLPELGENIEEAEVIRILVSEGDTIEAEQNVFELESEKAAVSLPSSLGGTVTKIHVQEGDAITVGQKLLTIEETKGEEKPEPPTDETEEPSEQKADRDQVEEQRPKQETREEKDVGEKKDEKEQRRVEPEKPAAKQKAKHKPDREIPAPAGPTTRRLARELGVDLYEVNGSGSGGRITQEDVKAFVKRQMDGGISGSAPALPDFSQWGDVKRERMSKLGRTSAGRLAASWQLIPHVTQHELADITELEAARKRYNEKHPNSAAKITVTAIAMKAVVPALRAFPHVNSSFDTQNGEVIFKEYYHIGVAVDTEHGLLVPVIRDVDKKSIVQIADELSDAANKARERKLSSEEMQGATFTITNLGGIAGTYFTPIINYPEVAILGMSRASMQETADGERLMLPLSLSYDHRVINGADAARFIRKVQEYLADAFWLLAEV